MVVNHLPASSDWFWQNHTCSVDSLENALAVDSPRNLFDEYGSQTLSSQFFVDAQEVDFNELMSLVVDPDGSRDGADEANHLVGLCCSHSTMPLFQPTY